MVKFENDVKHEPNVRLRWKLKCKTKIKWELIIFNKILKNFTINPLHCVVKFENDVKHEGNVGFQWNLKCKTKIKWNLIKFNKISLD